MLGLCLSWGFNQIAAKVALADIPPLTQAALRSAGGAVLLGAFALWREKDLFAPTARSARACWPGSCSARSFSRSTSACNSRRPRMRCCFSIRPRSLSRLGLLVVAPNERLSRVQWIGMGLAFVGVALALRVSGAVSRDILFGDLLCLSGGRGMGGNDHRRQGERAARGAAR
jgi:drug/metabolite transporter (DMT)-like permease